MVKRRVKKSNKSAWSAADSFTAYKIGQCKRLSVIVYDETKYNDRDAQTIK